MATLKYTLSQLGKRHSDETKKILSDKTKIRLQKPENNSQYGTMWIYSLEEKRNMKINKNDPIPEGWIKWRKINF